MVPTDCVPHGKGEDSRPRRRWRGRECSIHERTCIDAINSRNFNIIKGSCTIRGTNGNDVIIGSAGDDNISASNGNDVVCARGGNDRIDGGNGNDDRLGDRGGADPGPDGMIGTADDVDLLPEEYGPDGVGGVDTIAGSNGDDRLWGDEANDSLDGSNGNDQLRGGAGDDTLGGRNGNDFLDGMTGTADKCDGGNDTDTAANCEATRRVP